MGGRNPAGNGRRRPFVLLRRKNGKTPERPANGALRDMVRQCERPAAANRSIEVIGRSIEVIGGRCAGGWPRGGYFLGAAREATFRAPLSQ